MLVLLLNVSPSICPQKNIRDIKFNGAKVKEAETFPLDLEIIDCDYPNVSQVTDSVGKGDVYEIVLLGHVLENFIGSFPKTNSQPMRFEFSKPLGGIKVYENTRLIGLIMPARAPDAWEKTKAPMRTRQRETA